MASPSIEKANNLLRELLSLYDDSVIEETRFVLVGESYRPDVLRLTNLEKPLLSSSPASSFVAPTLESFQSPVNCMIDLKSTINHKDSIKASSGRFFEWFKFKSKSKKLDNCTCLHIIQQVMPIKVYIEHESAYQMLFVEENTTVSQALTKLLSALFINNSSSYDRYVLIEKFKDLGLERSLHPDENLFRILHSWNSRTQNTLIFKNLAAQHGFTSLTFPFPLKSAATCGWVYIEQVQKSTWQKRFVAIQPDRSLYAYANVDRLGESMFVSLKDYDFYTYEAKKGSKPVKDPSFLTSIYKKKAPTKYVIAFKAHKEIFVEGNLEFLVHMAVADANTMIMWLTALRNAQFTEIAPVVSTLDNDDIVDVSSLPNTKAMDICAPQARRVIWNYQMTATMYS